MKATAKRFDALVSRAAALLKVALELKGADSIAVSVNRTGEARIDDLYWEEREQAGTIGPTGAVKLGRKP